MTQTVDVAPKNFLTTSEMTKFLAAARQGKHGVRNYLLGMMAYRHGMRVSELIHIRLDDIDLDAGRIFVRRAKGSMSTSHPMQGDEVRAVRAWLRERKHFLPVPVLADSSISGSEPEQSASEARESTKQTVAHLMSVQAEGRQTDSRGGQETISRRGEVAVLNSGGNKPPSSTALGTDAARNGETPLEPDPSPCMVQPPASGHSILSGDVMSVTDTRMQSSERGLLCAGGTSGETTLAAGASSAQNFGVNGEATSRQIPSAHCGNVEADSSPFLFLNEKRRVFARQAINYLFGEIGKRAGIGHVNPHALRHSCGFTLANAGCDTRLIQDWLGHRCIEHTVRYTRTCAKRFEGLWK